MKLKKQCSLDGNCHKMRVNLSRLAIVWWLHQLRTSLSGILRSVPSALPSISPYPAAMGIPASADFFGSMPLYMVDSFNYCYSTFNMRIFAADLSLFQVCISGIMYTTSPCHIYLGFASYRSGPCVSFSFRHSD